MHRDTRPKKTTALLPPDDIVLLSRSEGGDRAMMAALIERYNQSLQGSFSSLPLDTLREALAQETPESKDLPKQGDSMREHEKKREDLFCSLNMADNLDKVLF
jgi:hypothetical protein